jgi:division protein CdvB (Snf7/Vps24/ESCRT-III family)
MVDDFVKGWERKRGSSRSVFRDLRPGPPLRERISHTIYRLNNVQRRLEEAESRMKARDKAIFHKCVKAQEARDTHTSTMYANEIAQVRKMTQIIVTSQLALEQVALRLETVQEFGDLATEIMPAAQIVRTIRDRVSGVLPEVSYMLGDICGTLDSVVIDAGQVTASTYHAATSEEAELILAEASAVAEQKMRDAFPSLPSKGLSETGYEVPK